MAITDFIAALDETRSMLAVVNGDIDKLELERQRLTLLPPHTDEIVGVFMRGLDAVSGSFTQQLAARLNDTFVGEGSAVAAGPQQSLQLLCLEPQKLDHEALLTRSLKGRTSSDLNVAALTYFLRDQIAAEIPDLVAKLCPAAAKGIKRADRDHALYDVDDRLAALRERQDALSAELGAARAALHRGG